MPDFSQRLERQNVIKYSCCGKFKYHDILLFFNTNIFVNEMHLTGGNHRVIIGKWHKNNGDTIVIQKIEYDDSLKNYFYNYTKCRIASPNNTVITTDIESLCKKDTNLLSKHPEQSVAILTSNYLELNNRLYKRNKADKNSPRFYRNEYKFGHFECYNIKKIEKNGQRVKNKIRKLFH